MTGTELRLGVVQIAQSWLDVHELTARHTDLIDYYNRLFGCRVYKMQYTDPWCAAFVSAVGMYAVEKYGLACKPYELIPASAACDPMIEAYKRLGRWIENDAYLPSPGDVIFYDWQDSGSGDCTGSSDHVGIVAKVSGDAIVVIEGNYSDQVKQRTIKRGDRFIRGYGIPDYDRWAATAGAEPQEGEGTIIVDTTAETPATAQDNRATALLPLVRYGDKGETVRAVQGILIARGYSCGRYGADGDFGNDTLAAVLAIQRWNRLEADGIVGAQTWAALLGL